MGYSYTATTPAAGSPFLGLPAPLPMPQPEAPPRKIDQILGLVIAIHGEEIAHALLRYTRSLRNAMHLSAKIERHAAEAGADLATNPAAAPDWASMEGELRSAAASYQDAAEAMDDLTGTKACSINLLANMPPALLGRVIAAGLECEADALLDLVESCCPPEPDGPGDDHEEPNVLGHGE